MALLTLRFGLLNLLLDLRLFLLRLLAGGIDGLFASLGGPFSSRTQLLSLRASLALRLIGRFIAARDNRGRLLDEGRRIEASKRSPGVIEQPALNGRGGRCATACRAHHRAGRGFDAGRVSLAGLVWRGDGWLEGIGACARRGA